MFILLQILEFVINTFKSVVIIVVVQVSIASFKWEELIW